MSGWLQNIYLILEDFDDSNSENKDALEATDNEDYHFAASDQSDPLEAEV